jgi:hypothetical protein
LASLKRTFYEPLIQNSSGTANFSAHFTALIGRTASLDVPVSLQGNANNAFYTTLKRLRVEVEQNARTLLVV